MGTSVSPCPTLRVALERDAEGTLHRHVDDVRLTAAVEELAHEERSLAPGVDHAYLHFHARAGVARTDGIVEVPVTRDDHRSRGQRGRRRHRVELPKPPHIA